MRKALEVGQGYACLLPEHISVMGDASALVHVMVALSVKG